MKLKVALFVLFLVTEVCLTLFVTPWTVAPQALLSMDSPGKNTGVGSHSFFQGIFPTQGLNPSLLHFRQILYHVSYQGGPFLSKLTQDRIFKYA